MAALLTACAQGSATADPSVSLLPDATAQGQAWNWSAGCPFSPSINPSVSPSGPKACTASDPELGAAQLDGDEWNLGGGPSTAGTVSMSVDGSGALTVRGDLPSTPPCTASTCLAPSAYTWVRGYPDVLYGINQCHADTSPPVSTRLPLPMQVSAIPGDLIGTTSYSSHTSHVTYDVAYDMWLHKSATRTPCRTEGTVEVMVWTDYDERAVLPESLNVGSATVPYSVDGAVHGGAHAWTMYAANISKAGGTAPWGGTVWFVPNRADVVDRGTVGVDLSTVLADTATLLQNTFGWTSFATHYWLDSVPFGMEYGPADGSLTGAGPSNFSLSLSAYCLAVKTKLSDPAC